MSQQISEALGKLDLMIAGAAGGGAAGAPAAELTTAAAPAGGQGSVRQRLAAAFQQGIDAAFPAMAGEPAIVAVSRSRAGPGCCLAGRRPRLPLRLGVRGCCRRHPAARAGGAVMVCLAALPVRRCPQPCNNPKFGDYQCNNAMALHGKMKGKVRGAAERGCGG